MRSHKQRGWGWRRRQGVIGWLETYCESNSEQTQAFFPQTNEYWVDKWHHSRRRCPRLDKQGKYKPVSGFPVPRATFLQVHSGHGVTEVTLTHRIPLAEESLNFVDRYLKDSGQSAVGSVWAFLIWEPPASKAVHGMGGNGLAKFFKGVVSVPALFDLVEQFGQFACDCVVCDEKGKQLRLELQP